MRCTTWSSAKSSGTSSRSLPVLFVAVVGGMLAEAATRAGFEPAWDGVVSCLAGCTAWVDAARFAPALGSGVAAAGSVTGAAAAATGACAAEGAGVLAGAWPRIAATFELKFRYSQATNLRTPGCVAQAPYPAPPTTTSSSAATSPPRLPRLRGASSPPNGCLPMPPKDGTPRSSSGSRSATPSSGAGSESLAEGPSADFNSSSSPGLSAFLLVLPVKASPLAGGAAKIESKLLFAGAAPAAAAAAFIRVCAARAGAGLLSSAVAAGLLSATAPAAGGRGTTGAGLGAAGGATTETFVGLSEAVTGGMTVGVGPATGAVRGAGDGGTPAAAGAAGAAGVETLDAFAPAGALPELAIAGTKLAGVLGSGASLRVIPTPVRSVLRTCSSATGLVSTRLAPRRNAFGTPALPSTMAMAMEFLFRFEARALLKTCVAF